MLNANHPDEERLSALASRDADLVEDTALTDHVASCDGCRAVVSELNLLRATLADLPDLRPDRPLRLLPPVEPESEPVGAVGWIRRLFAPALTVGASLALVGAVGTAAPLLDEVTVQLFQNVGSELSGGGAEEADSGGARATDQPEALSSGGAAPAAGSNSGNDVDNGEVSTDGGAVDEMTTRDLPAERSPWPMVLFTGVALMIAVGLLRWILVPRAG